MHVFAIIAGAVIILVVLLDAFETVVLPRRVQRHFRITVWFYRYTWVPYAKLASHIHSQRRRESMLGYFGPLSMIAINAVRCASVSRGSGPGALRSSSPSGPSALNRSTQSRMICNPTSPTRAASLRLPPS